MPWQVLTTISIVTLSIANLFQRQSMKQKASDPLDAAIIFQLLLALFTGIFAFSRGFEFPPPPQTYPFLLLSTLLYAVGSVCIFSAIKSIEASELTIVSGFGSFATLSAAFLFLGERLIPIQILGILCIFSAVYVVQKGKNSKIVLDKGLVFALLGSFLYGIAIISDIFTLRSYDAVSYTCVMSLLPSLVLLGYSFLRRKKISLSFTSHVDRYLLIYSLLYSVQAVTYYLALERGALISAMSVLFKTVTILTILLSAIFLRERTNMRQKFFALCLTIIGVLLVAL